MLTWIDLACDDTVFFFFFFFFFSFLLLCFVVVVFVFVVVVAAVVAVVVVASVVVVVSAAVVVAKHINVGLLFARTCIYPVAVVVVAAAAAAVVAAVVVVAAAKCINVGLLFARTYIYPVVGGGAAVLVVVRYINVGCYSQEHESVLYKIPITRTHTSLRDWITYGSYISIQKQKQKHSITPKIYMVCFVLINSDLLNLFLCLNVSLFSG